MGREADQRGFADQGTRQLGSEILLSDVDAVRTGGCCEIRSVVDDEGDVVVGADPSENAGRAEPSPRRRGVLSRSCTTSTPPSRQAATKRSRSGRFGVQR